MARVIAVMSQIDPILLDPVLGSVLRGALALLFVFSAVHKLGDLSSFRSALEGYALVPRRLGMLLAPGFAICEFGVAIALAIPSTAALGAWSAGILLLIYSGAVAINLARGRRDIACGCVGVAGRAGLGMGLLLRNGLLLVVAALAVFPHAPRAWIWLDGVTLVAGWVTLSILYTTFETALANAPRLAMLRGHG